MAESKRDFRAGVLTAFGAAGAAVEELLAFGDAARRPAATGGAPPPLLPLPAEPHVEVWREYAAAAAEVGAWDVLRRRLPQLQFPIAEGISQTEEYRAATRRGEPARPPDDGLKLHAPERLRLWVRESPAGPVPVLCTAERDDFVRLVQALSNRNEPEPVPDAMGACLVSGFNNADRLRRLRERRGPAAWAEEFERILPHKTLYQDRFLILSDGPYSGVAAESLGLASEEWLRLSHAIRLAHECTHYLFLRLFGATFDHPLDELIADYVGITAAWGRYRADWALLFLGLEDRVKYRAGGRLENYRGRPPLSDDAFRVLQGMVRAAAANLERFDAGQTGDRMGTATTLIQTSLEELACRRAG